MIPVVAKFLGTTTQLIRLAIGWVELRRVAKSYKSARKAAKSGDVDTLNDILR